MKRHIAILGSTGSIGTQALQVISEHPDLFTVEVLTAQSNANLLIEQARTFVPNVVVIGDDVHYERVKSSLSDLPIKVDLVDWHDISVEFQQLILKNYQVIQEGE